MKLLSLIVACACVGIIFTGCSMTDDRAAATQIGAAFYESVKADDINSILTFLSPEFFGETSENDMRLLLPTLKETFGAIESYDLIGWHVNKRFGTDSLSGTLVTLQYKVTYSKTPSNEMLLLYKPSGSEEFKIISYNFNIEPPEHSASIDTLF
ncbi:MAG: hypothetical protein R3F48_01930 [Candidatus Zixiibacteriota bacterium]